MKKRVLLTVHVDLHQEMRVAAARRKLTLGALDRRQLLLPVSDNYSCRSEPS